MKKTMKRMLTMAFALVLLLTLALPAAAEQEAVLGLATCWDSADEVILSRSGIVGVYDGEISVFTAPEVYLEEAAESYTLMLEDGETMVDLEYLGSLGDDVDCVLFTTDMVSTSTMFLQMRGAVQNEQAWLHYFDQDLNERIVRCQIKDFSEKEYVYVLDVTLEETPAIGVDGDGDDLMAAVVSDNGELLGIRTTEGDYISRVISANFYGGSAPAPDDDPEPEPEPQPDGGSDTDADDGAKGRDEKNDDEVKDDEEVDMLGLLLLLGGVAAVVVVIVLVIVLICVSGKKKKQARMAPPPVYNPIPPVPPIQPVAPVFDPAPPAGPTEPVIPEPVAPPVMTPEPITPTAPMDFQPPRKEGGISLALFGIGGPMDGYRYPVGKNPITFGRELSNTVCYPADTQGVSRKHCQLFWHNGALMLMDMGSTSGTYLKGKGQLAPNVPTALRIGDTFYLGEKRNGFTLREE